ncbi:MAG: hypothetical protein QXL24_02535 [Candidatus Jordarchaeaceae archaeon]
MSNSITAGVFGAVVGLVSTIVGILWSLQYYALASLHQTAVTIQNMLYVFEELTFFIGFFHNLQLNSAISGFLGVTAILAILLLVTLILVGLGLYGIGKIEGKTMGTVGLVIGIIAAILILLLLILGVTAGGTVHTLTSIWVLRNLGWVISMPLNPGKIMFLVLMSGVPSVSTSLLWLGLLVLGITVIIFGATFILMRETLSSPGLAVAAGVLYIISGIFLFAGVLVPWLAFIILFVSFIMSALIFFQAREQA